ncbi:MAG: hypothetical protein A4E47_01533 [Methanosaeta sp. PtaU1.Bin028]|nr:MAG: hypothetical protein A4E47_01533 [Methanosaeta sp. PtaU1.Bin028]
MPRELDEDDLKILGKLAPELEHLICSGSGVEYRSILPPVANHFSYDDADFATRLERLTPEELKHIARLIPDGRESLGCLEPESAEIFFQILERKVGEREAQEARQAYQNGGECYI